MQNAALMGVVDRAANFDKRFDVFPQWTIPFELRCQVAAFDEPHREIMCAVAFPAFVQRDDMGMVQLGDRFDLDAKTQARFVREKVVRLNHLERDYAVQTELTRAINDAHASSPEFLKNFVIAEKPRLQAVWQWRLRGGSRGLVRGKRQPKRARRASKTRGACRNLKSAFRACLLGSRFVHKARL